MNNNHAKQITTVLNLAEAAVTDVFSERQVVLGLIKNPAAADAIAAQVPGDLIRMSHLKFTYAMIMALCQTCRLQGIECPTITIESLYQAAWTSGRMEEFSKHSGHIRDLLNLAQNTDDDTLRQGWPLAVQALHTAHARAQAIQQAGQLAATAVSTTDLGTLVQSAAEIGNLSYQWTTGVENLSFRKLGDIQCGNRKKAPRLTIRSMPKWSNLLGGLRPGVHVVGGRAKAGKSQFLLNAGIDLAQQGVPVLYLDSEMGPDLTTLRVLAHLSGINTRDIDEAVSEDPSHEHRHQYDQAVHVKDNLPLYHCYVAGRTPEEIAHLMRGFHRRIVSFSQLGHGVIIFDYLKLDAASTDRNRQEWQALGDLLNLLQQAANELSMPILTAAQLNREALDRNYPEAVRAGEKVIGGSDRITQYATSLSVLFTPQEDEIDAIRSHFGINVPDGEEAKHHLPFNQILLVPCNRVGDDCRRGLPLKACLGHARYEEKSVVVEAGADGKPIWRDSPETQFIRSERFARPQVKRVKANFPSQAALNKSAADMKAANAGVATS